MIQNLFDIHIALMTWFTLFHWAQRRKLLTDASDLVLCGFKEAKPKLQIQVPSKGFHV